MYVIRQHTSYQHTSYQQETLYSQLWDNYILARDMSLSIEENAVKINRNFSFW